MSPEERTRIDEARKKMAAAQQKYGALLQACAPILVDHYRRGLTGYDFRDWLMDAHGALNWSALKDEVGAETMTQLCMSHNILKTALQPPEKLYHFLTEVFTAIGEEDADIEGAEPEERGAKPNA